MGECWGMLLVGLAKGPSSWRGDQGVLAELWPGVRSKTNALNISQKMIEMFVRTKHKIDKCHEFALVVVNNDATWVSGDGMGWMGWGWGWLLSPSLWFLSALRVHLGPPRGLQLPL